MESRPTVYEFFAGGGMARLGLAQAWDVVFANDLDAVKADAYAKNFGAKDLKVADVWALSTADLPGRADLAWASSPCQDLSLAGPRLGLSGARSSAFWGFWRLVQDLAREGRAPRTIVIENVCGLFTSHGGADFAALCQALADQGYRFGALEVDAALFVPQSRPRLFIVATLAASPACTQPAPAIPFHSLRVRQAYHRLPSTLQARWAWWALDPPPPRNTELSSVLDPDNEVVWRTADQTRRLLADLAPAHLEKLQTAKAAGTPRVGALFRRMRIEDGIGVTRAELRFDGVAGCLRTPAGGSSRQFLVVVEGERVRTRLLSAREGARLMGLPDSYRLPARATAAFKVIGDGVACPVVRHLSLGLLERLCAAPMTLAAE